MKKRVFISGAQGALGQEVLNRFLKEDFEVFGSYYPQHIGSFESMKNVHWIQMDITQPASVKKALASQEFDYFIHCAGGFRFAKADEVSNEDLNFLIDVNLKSTFFLLHEILPGMKKRNFGRIVFISSRATLQAGTGMAAYAASKAGLNMITSALAEETKSFNITVNSVLPTVIDTPTNRKDMPDADFKSWVSPKDLAEIIFSLVSPLGQPIHGALIPVSGRV